MPLPAVILSAVAAVKAYFRRCFNFENLTDLDDFSQDTLNSLAELYSTLFVVSIFITAGLYLQVEDELGGPLTMVGLAGSMYGLFLTPQRFVVLRSIFLHAAALFMGASWFPYTQPYLNFIDPRFIIAVLLGNILCLGCFRTVTRWVQGRDRFAIYSYAIIYSTLLSMVWTGTAFYHFNFYLVLVTFLYLLLLSVYVIAYSQEMVVRDRAGQEIDCVNFTMRFFTDALGVTICGLVLLFMFAYREGLSVWELVLMLIHSIAARLGAKKQGPKPAKQGKQGKKGKRRGKKN